MISGEPPAPPVVARLIDIIDHGSDTDSLRAIEQISNRVNGKPKETVAVQELSETERDIAALTPEEREALLRRLEAQRGGSLLRLLDEHDN